MMEVLEWEVPLTWSYNPAEIAKEAREQMENYGYTYDEALAEVIENSIRGEDDSVYYNFGDSEFDAVIKRVKELYPYNEQLTLFD